MGEPWRALTWLLKDWGLVAFLWALKLREGSYIDEKG
jgi:hypothetical protein